MSNSIAKTSNGQEKILTIIGPTGSGKTGLAIDVALELSRRRGILMPDCACEVISADSRAIYKEMNIGTAKPTPEEMRGVPHFGIDLVGPNERFTVVDFKDYAEQIISEIRNRGHLPIVAGGTGLYVDALVYDYSFSEDAKKSYADREQMSEQFLVIGIDWPRDVLKKRLRIRAEQFFEQPIVDEYERVAKMYDWDSQAMKSNIYPIVRDMVEGRISREEAIELFITDDWHLAKRQLTWFHRNPNIIWLPLDRARDYILNSYT
jgi:tRNA dimethylallyltransferase